MQILIAEDDPVSRRALEAILRRWDYDVIAVADGAAAWDILQTEQAPRLAILDWMMPFLDGPDVCRRVQDQNRAEPRYLMLLTARGTKEDMVSGLRSGADDYVTKPFNRDELLARIQVGIRMIGLQQKLADRVRDLEEALSKVKQLQSLLPICCYCKKIRNDQNYWQQVDSYLSKEIDARFSHGICPDCYKTVVESELREHLDREQ
jgi:sigma-B regulation protein RsbU (phosphoserine phosphatase)